MDQLLPNFDPLPPSTKRWSFYILSTLCYVTPFLLTPYPLFFNTQLLNTPISKWVCYLFVFTMRRLRIKVYTVEFRVSTCLVYNHTQAFTNCLCTVNFWQNKYSRLYSIFTYWWPGFFFFLENHLGHTMQNSRNMNRVSNSFICGIDNVEHYGKRQQMLVFIWAGLAVFYKSEPI